MRTPIFGILIMVFLVLALIEGYTDQDLQAITSLLWAIVLLIIDRE